MSITVNVMVTALIVFRLISARRMLAKAMGTAGRQDDKIYMNVSAILVESAALYTIPAIVFLIGYSLKNVLDATIDALEVIQVFLSHMPSHCPSQPFFHRASRRFSSSCASPTAVHTRQLPRPACLVISIRESARTAQMRCVFALARRPRPQAAHGLNSVRVANSSPCRSYCWIAKIRAPSLRSSPTFR